MAELADAIVQCGRDALERAIRTVHDSGDERWSKARVVYGDTDSLFVHFPGYSRAKAFEAASAIAAAVTAENPDPVTLKLEKIYHPCILASKKRYVGHSYESVAQTVPIFDAKGIEAVRRDSCPFLVKTQTTSLQVLFHTKDLSLVKRYLQRQVAKVRSREIPLDDLVFAKETRLGTYSKTPGAVKPPTAIIAESLMAKDPRAEPKFGERVPYLVVSGEPGGRLVDAIAHPRAIAEAGAASRVDANYYTGKILAPAMQRLLGLVGADVFAWVRETPYRSGVGNRAAGTKRAGAPGGGGGGGGASASRALARDSRVWRAIDEYYLSRHCSVCGDLTHLERAVCEPCAANPGVAAARLAWRASALENAAAKLHRVCLGCGGGGGAVDPGSFVFRGCVGLGSGESRAGGGPPRPPRAIECVSLDCPAYFARMKTEAEFRAAAARVEAAFQPGGGLDRT
jgi:DNA polymerase zeta